MNPQRLMSCYKNIQLFQAFSTLSRRPTRPHFLGQDHLYDGFVDAPECMYLRRLYRMWRKYLVVMLLEAFPGRTSPSIG